MELAGDGSRYAPKHSPLGQRVVRPSVDSAARRKVSVLLVLLAVVTAAGLTVPRRAMADPWLSPGDVQARQDVELLADTGVINVPITTWPIPWGSLAAALGSVNIDKLSPVQQLAYERLLEDIRTVQAGSDQVGYKLEAAPGRPALNWFGDTTRGKQQAGTSWSGYNGNLAFRFNVAAVYGSRDHQRVRFDGSYLGVELGNWILSAGQIDQYWGPGWSGSLILGTNSRPVPAVMLTRNVAEPFQTPILHWLGPWTMTVFAGRLEDDRYIRHPYLLGMRVAFRPLAGVEIGFSRTAEFGGKSRPQSWNCLWKSFIGRTNQTSGSRAADCSNQLAGMDARFNVPHTHFVFYGQMNAEDTSKASLTKWTDLLGLSRWGSIGSYGANYRTFLEYANTTVNSYKTPKPNIEYENSIYQSGYRYRGFALGYPTDNDSELWTLGLTLQGTDNGEMTFIVRHGTLNRDNTNNFEPWGGNKLAPVRTALDEADVYFSPSLWGGRLDLGLGITRWGPAGLPVELGLHAEIGWQMGFSE